MHALVEAKVPALGGCMLCEGWVDERGLQAAGASMTARMAIPPLAGMDHEWCCGTFNFE